VLQTVIDRAVLICHADSGNIARRVGDVYRMAAFTSFGPEDERMVREHVYEPGRGSVIGRTILERGVVHIVDVLEDPDYAMSNLQSAGGYRTTLGVPMLKDGEPIGAIAVGRNEVRPFSDAEIRLLQTFAARSSWRSRTCGSPRRLSGSGSSWHVSPHRSESPLQRRRRAPPRRPSPRDQHPVLRHPRIHSVLGDGRAGVGPRRAARIT
jgi:hypothetical protein